MHLLYLAQTVHVLVVLTMRGEDACWHGSGEIDAQSANVWHLSHSLHRLLSHRETLRVRFVFSHPEGGPMLGPLQTCDRETTELLQTNVDFGLRRIMPA